MCVWGRGGGTASLGVGTQKFCATTALFLWYIVLCYFRISKPTDSIGFEMLFCSYCCHHSCPSTGRKFSVIVLNELFIVGDLIKVINYNSN